MFQSYQSGPAVEVLNAKDKSLPGRFSAKGKTQVFEKSVKGFILALETPTMKLCLPADEKASLNLIQPYLVLQILILPGQSFTLELVITDSTSTKRRLIFSSASKDLAMTPLHVRIPNRAMLRGQWLNLSIDMISFTGRCFQGVTFRSLDAILISSYCRLRRVFTMRCALFDESQGDSLQGITYEPVPKAYEFPAGVDARSQLFHSGLIVSEDSQDTEQTDTDTPKPPVHKPASKLGSKRLSAEKTSHPSNPSNRPLRTAVPGAAVKISTRVPPGTAPLTAAPQSPASMRSSGLMFRSTLTGLSSHPSRYDIKPQVSEEPVEEMVAEEAKSTFGNRDTHRKSDIKLADMQIPECIEEPSAIPDADTMGEEGEEPGHQCQPPTPPLSPPLAPPLLNVSPLLVDPSPVLFAPSPPITDQPHSSSSEALVCDSPKASIHSDEDDEIGRLSVRESIHLADSLDATRPEPPQQPLEDSLEMRSPNFSCSSENPLDKVNSFRDGHSHPPSARFNHRLQDQSAVSIVEELEGSEFLEDSLEPVEEQKEIAVPSYYREAVDLATKYRPFTPPFAGLDKSRSYKSPLLMNPSAEDEDEEVELVLDPVLGCYYDPKTHEYYELKE